MADGSAPAHQSPGGVIWTDATVTATLAMLAEQTFGLQRQLTRMEAVFAEEVRTALAALRETEARVTALTDAKFVTYRTLIDSQAEKVALALNATDTAIGKAEAATSKAIDKAEVANDARFASVNEFRAQLNDQARTFMPRTEVSAMTDRFSERINELSDRMNRREGQGEGQRDNRAGIYAAIAAAVGLIAIVVFVANMLSGQ